MGASFATHLRGVADSFPPVPLLTGCADDAAMPVHTPASLDCAKENPLRSEFLALGMSSSWAIEQVKRLASLHDKNPRLSGFRYCSFARLPHQTRRNVAVQQTIVNKAAKYCVAIRHNPGMRFPGKDASEHQHQVALFQWAELSKGKFPELEMLVAIPNGGLRSKAVAAKLKAEGVKAGYLDLALNVARGGFHGLFIEMKSMTGYATKEQKEWIQRHEKHGNRAVVCNGWDAAREEIETYLKLEAQ